MFQNPKPSGRQDHIVEILLIRISGYGNTTAYESEVSAAKAKTEYNKEYKVVVECLETVERIELKTVSPHSLRDTYGLCFPELATLILNPLAALASCNPRV